LSSPWFWLSTVEGRLLDCRALLVRSSSPSVCGFASAVPGWSAPLGSDLNKGGGTQILLTPS
jgi:hypothetical protein